MDHQPIVFELVEDAPHGPEAVAPGPVEAEVDRLCRQGDQGAALTALARAVDALMLDSHPPQEIAPRVEAVLAAWGYRPLPGSPAAD